MWNIGLIAFLGVWMLLVPLVLPDARAQAVNCGVVGGLVIALSVASPRTLRWETVAAGATGVWLFASSFVPELRFGYRPWWTDVALGILLLVTGCLATARIRARTAPLIGESHR